MFSSSCYIRKNTPELISALKGIGYYICACCGFEDSEYLCISNLDEEFNGVVHGIGYREEYDKTTKEDELLNFVQSTHLIDCGDNENLFLELASIEDDDDNKSIQESVLNKYGL